MSKFTIRPYMKLDENFVYDSWLETLHHENDWFNEISDQNYYPNYRKIINHIIADSRVKISIACLKDDEEVILGYSVIQNDILHWILVKKAFRNLGIAKALVPTNIKVCSHLTKVGKYLKKKYDLEFNPFV